MRELLRRLALRVNGGDDGGVDDGGDDVADVANLKYLESLVLGHQFNQGLKSKLLSRFSDISLSRSLPERASWPNHWRV